MRPWAPGSFPLQSTRSDQAGRALARPQHLPPRRAAVRRSGSFGLEGAFLRGPPVSLIPVNQFSSCFHSRGRATATRRVKNSNTSGTFSGK